MKYYSNYWWNTSVHVKVTTETHQMRMKICTIVFLALTLKQLPANIHRSTRSELPLTLFIWHVCYLPWIISTICKILEPVLEKMIVYHIWVVFLYAHMFVFFSGEDSLCKCRAGEVSLGSIIIGIHIGTACIIFCILFLCGYRRRYVPVHTLYSFLFLLSLQ